MLEGLLGNKSAVKVMLALFVNEELHASAIAQIYQTALDPIKKQLERFEEAEYLVSRVVGRSKLYSFNEAHPIFEPLMQMIEIALKAENQKIKKTLKSENVTIRTL